MALRLKGQTTGYVELASPASAASNTLTLPNGNGTNGQVLTTNGSGTLSFTTKADIASPTFTGTPAAPTAGSGTNTTQIATTAFVTTATSGKANTGTTNTFSALQTLNAGLSVDGPYKQTAETVSSLNINLATGNYFTKSISSSSTITFSNPPASGTVGSFTLEIVVTGSSTAITWPNTVYWNADAGQTAPSLTDARTHLFMFTTTDGGTKYRGAALVDYTN